MENQVVIENAVPKKNYVPFIIAGVALLCCCLVVVAAVGYTLIVGRTFNSVSENGGVYNGLADELLKTDALNAIKQYEASESGCKDVSLFLGSVITPPASSADGSWLEEWQVNACGESHLYSVAFTPSPGGGTDFSITRIDQ